MATCPYTVRMDSHPAHPLTPAEGDTARRYDVLIVGGGHSGRHTALALRDGGYAGSIGLVDAQPDPFYERPPLSKDYVRGEISEDELQLRPRQTWHDLRIDLILGTPVQDIDASKRIVSTPAGDIGYGRLVWAAGGRARSLMLPGFDAPGVGSLRTLDDAQKLRTSLRTGTRIAIVGGGYIGLEVAASARKLGVDVTVLEAQDRILSRVTSAPVSEYLTRIHETAGAEIRTGVTIEGIEREHDRHIVAVAGGPPVAADAVLVGVGLVPNIEPLQKAGAAIDNGILVNEHCETSIPGIYAIGDCANRLIDGARIRVESVPNATETATIAADAILGRAPSVAHAPWFWSHQYELKLQTAGVLTGYDEYVLRGDPDDGRFSVVYLRDGALRAIDTIGRVADFASGRKLIGRRLVGSVEELADPTTPLTSLFS